MCGSRFHAAVLKKALDAEKSTAEALVQLIKDELITTPTPSHIGRHLDVRA